MKNAWLFAGILFSVASVSEAASNLVAPHVRVQLVSELQTLSRSSSAQFGISFQLEPHWHIYWKNPGDSGAAPKFRFESPDLKIQDVRWPVPSRIPFGDFTNIGYENEVVFPFEVSVLPGAGSTARLTADLEWLVCREECVPGFGKLEIVLPVAEQGVASSDAAKILEFASLVPVTPVNFPAGKISYDKVSPDLVEVKWTTKNPMPVSDLQHWELFPADGERFVAKAPKVSMIDSTLRFEILQQSQTAAVPSDSFALVNRQSSPIVAYEIDFKKSVVQATAETDGLWWLLLSAILGGMILNLMPCVFPVLSIKVFSFLKAHEGDSGALVKDGLFYTLGSLVAFAALGAVFLLLRQGGEAVGWGFQLQSPVVVFLLALLFFVLALNFLGVFELGTFIMNWAGVRSSKQGWTSAFGTGVLSVFIAAPCTGPFMGAALGASTVLPAASAMLIFLGLGFGLALPLLILCLFPQWLKKLPRPGAWMETLKEFFAFPLFATVIWLLWVLTQQTGADGVLWVGGSFLVVSFAFWLARRKWKWFAVLMFAVGVAGPVWALKSLQATSVSEASGAWIPYSEELVTEARKNGRAVFVDFTAAWCITCQWNKKSVLETSAIKVFLKNKMCCW